ncbi:MAG: hypothetical protein RLZZ122_712 [Actinomycetota bacterium]|jgi:hypothetical protein
MAKITIQGNHLRVKLSWLEKVAALQGSFELPLEKIRGATDDPTYLTLGEVGVRSPGTGFPGIIAYGTFRKIGQNVLCLWRRGQETVVIELIDSKWDRLVIGCENAKELAKAVNAAIS